LSKLHLTLINLCLIMTASKSKKGYMERLNKSQMKQQIEELYFDKLEEDCVDFVEYNDIGNGQTESLIKDEFIETVENMIDYIWGIDNWIGQWTLDLYNSAKEN
jgi:hypothetical protein